MPEMVVRWLIPLLLLGLAWGQEVIDQLLLAGQWNLPMGPGLPLWRVLSAPFSHSGFGHLISNTLVFLPLSWLVLTRGNRDYIAVWIGVLLVDVPIALLWPAAGHGLSGVVYGSTLFALIPGVSPAGVSWIGHAGGFLGGVLAAFAIQRDPNHSAQIKGS